MGLNLVLYYFKFVVRRTKIIKQRIINVGIIFAAAVYGLVCASIVISLILPITDVIERAFIADSYSDAPTVTCSRKFENWTEAEKDPGSNQSDSSALKSLLPYSSFDFRPGITPPEVCSGVFDDRVITTGQPRLLPEYTMSDALAAALWPFWWVFALGFLVSWIFIYVIFGLTAVNPVSTIKAILRRVTTDRDKRSI